MDCHTAWQSADYCIVICDDSDSVWQNVQNLYVYGNRPDSDFLICRRTHAVHRKELYPFLCRRMSGRAIIALACIIFSAYAASPPAVGDTELSAVTIVWNYVGELVFNLLVLVGAIKASDRIVREMMGLGG